uniref:Carm_PH domain-containing protein n=1 Tax=Angiostrongylus cantonensis TaxID=6313 RepID=A0A0K0D9X6_ANGCA
LFSEKPSAVLGNKFFDYRIVLPSEISYKGEKFEPRIFVISKFRIFLLTGKSPSSLKIDRSYHILAIKSINTLKGEEVAISFEDAGHRKRYVIKSSQTTASVLIKHILSSLLRYFPDIRSQLQSMIELTPESLYNEFSTMNGDAEARACHSFRRTYAALCDYYDQPYREEVSWDVEKIYTVNRVYCLRVEDFSHLLPKDLLPITGVLQYSSYFTGLIADGTRITAEVIDVIMGVIRKSRCLQQLHLTNCALPRDFITLFASALQQNTSIPLESIDLSKNVLDDKKGFILLSGVLPRLSKLRKVNFSECALSDKCLQFFFAGIYSGLTAKSNSGMGSSITHLILSTNVLKDEVSSLVNVVSLCTSLRVLELTDTGFPLDKIWAALKYGGLQIEKLCLGGCYAGKKPIDCVQVSSTKKSDLRLIYCDVISSVLQQVKEFFSMAVNLSHISFANTILPADTMKALLLGLASNQQNCGAVLETCLAGVQCSSISLRDNNLETDMQGVVHALGNMKKLRRVDLGGANLIALRRSSKQAHVAIINKIILDIVKLFSDESPLEELILSDARLGPHLSVLLNTLGTPTSLRLLDISNNDLGQFGARILSKALQLNVSLRTIIIDNNHLGLEGLLDLAMAVNMNRTLTSIPYPMQDVCECLSRAGCDRSRILSAMSEIELSLERNRSPTNSDMANFRMTSATLCPENHEKCNCLGDILSNTAEDALSRRMEEMVDDFVEQMRRECALNLQNSIFRHGGVSEEYSQRSGRAEKIAVQRLKELWRDVLIRVFRLIDSGHRPRSIIGDLHSPLSAPLSRDDESGITLDAPPQPSALVHLQKSRPRLPRRSGISCQTRQLQSHNEETSMSHSTDIDEEAQSTKSDENVADVSDVVTKKHPSERVGFRAAMLPDAGFLSQVLSRSAADRAVSPKPESPVQNSALSSPGPSCSPRITTDPDSPPPLPNRVRNIPIAAPSLPPKPGSRNGPITAQVIAESIDINDENANNRRSVADMAKIFDR